MKSARLDMDIAKLLEEKAAGLGEKPAIIFKGQRTSFLQLKESSFKLANALKGIGIGKGDKVAIYLPNWPQYCISYLACWSIGAACVPLDFMLTEDELVSCINHSEAKALIAKSKASLSLEKIKSRSERLENIIVCQQEKEGFFSFEELIEKSSANNPQVHIEPKDYAIIFYTSGTTGKPKGVLINYQQLEAPPKSMTFFVDLKHEDIALSALPFSHLGGLIYLQNCIVYGITVVLMDRFSTHEFLKNVQDYRVSCFWLVPSMYYALLQLKDFESFNMESVRWMVIFGAPSSADALRRFHAHCPKTILLNGWGMTETNAPTCVIPMGSEKIESVGRPVPWVEVKIFDDNDKELQQGQAGEIVVRGWVVTDGYFKDPELTAQTMRNGWFHTGDLGRFDRDGYLYIVGRKKEMIKVAGEIVFEPEVESVILKHQAVAEAAVIGVPDKLRGEVPKAFVVRKEGSSLSEEELRSFLKEHLAHYKIPHYFEFPSQLPKNRTGKTDKEILRK